MGLGSMMEENTSAITNQRAIKNKKEDFSWGEVF